MRELPPLSERTVTAAFRRVLAASPDKTAHIFGSRSWTFREAFDNACRLGGALRSVDPQTSAPIALMLDNSADFVHAWMGIALTGRIQCPINTSYRGTFLSHILNDSASGVLVIEAAYLERLSAVSSGLAVLKVVVVRGEFDPAAVDLGDVRVVELSSLDMYPPATPVDVSPSDVMAYMYTSGTTGPSKGVEVTFAHAYTYGSREDQELPTADDRTLVTLPLFHLAGQWYGTYQALIHQTVCVIEPSFSVSRFWDIVREHRITATVMLGAMAELLQQVEPAADDANNTLRICYGAPLPSDPTGFSRRFATALEPVYGMSEIGAVLGSYGTDLVPGESGVIRPEYTAKLVDTDGIEVTDGEVGELWIRPRYPELVMTRYHGLPEKTAETLVDGWVHTGDAFRREDGHYFFADRMKDALRRRGENVSSFEVERVINEYPDVFESAVVGVPAELGEDEIKAVIVMRDGVEIDPVRLTDFLRERLPYFMVPRYLQIVSVLPKTPTHKIQKHILRESGVTDTWDREAAGIVLTRKS